MSRKIFVTYKYGDTNVKALRSDFPELVSPTKVRDYVDLLQDILDADDHINKGETDGEDLSHFKDSTIASKLRDKIYDSSITIVMISPNMKEFNKSEDDQWIPWEISYSLKEHTRNDRTSQTNAVLAVVLPDRCGSYDYFIRQNSCCSSTCRTLYTNKLFAILGNNMFNVKYPDKETCTDSREIYHGYESYIYSIEWGKFKGSPNYYLQTAIKINENIDDYTITKTVS